MQTTLSTDPEQESESVASTPSGKRRKEMSSYTPTRQKQRKQLCTSVSSCLKHMRYFYIQTLSVQTVIAKLALQLGNKEYPLALQE